MATTTTRSASVVGWAKSLAFGVVLAASLGLIAALVRGGDFWLTAGVFALCTLGPATGFGMLGFLGLDGPEEEHAEESIERRWFDRSASGAFLDVLLASSVALAIVSVFDVSVEGIDALLGVVVLAMVSSVIRYLVISRRES